MEHLGGEWVFVIAEAGVNHNGSLDLALQLVDAAHAAGANAVKFQTFKSESVVSVYAAKADYQVEMTGPGESQLDMVRKLELSFADHLKLVSRCEELGIQFLSTAFDLESADFLIGQLDLPILKVPSGEITNAPLLYRLAKSGKPIVLSTGMSCLGDIEGALGVVAYGYLGGESPCMENFQKAYVSDEGYALLKERVTLLHCTTEYPTPFAEVNLGVMQQMGEAFALDVGYSDHTQGIAIPLAAVAMGARVIEKHFTMDNNLPGPDHQASLEPENLKAMVDGIRQVELAAGRGRKVPSPSELRNIGIVRKSLVASRSIRRGEILKAENMTAKRPGGGLTPMIFWDLVGRPAIKDYVPDEQIVLDAT